MENQLTPVSQESKMDLFLNPSGFDHLQRVAKALSSSDLVPKEYKGNISNTLIALDIASRIGASPLMVMQHLYIVHGKPSWSSTFLIAAINSSNRFTSLRFEITGENDQKGCIAIATDKQTGEILESPKITLEMAKKEGWFDKNGSKWKTMPELMMRYRAAAFFSRLYCPEITMGMQTVEEIQDAVIVDEPDNKRKKQLILLDELNPDWQKVIEGLKKKSVTIEQLQKKYEISESIFKTLQDVTNTGV